jgi:hypothetical protein
LIVPSFVSFQGLVQQGAGCSLGETALETIVGGYIVEDSLVRDKPDQVSPPAKGLVSESL